MWEKVREEGRKATVAEKMAKEAEERTKATEEQSRLAQGKANQARDQAIAGEESAKIGRAEAYTREEELKKAVKNAEEKFKTSEEQLKRAKTTIETFARSHSPPESPAPEDDIGPAFKKKNRLDNSVDMSLQTWRKVCKDFDARMAEFQPLANQPIDHYATRLAID